MGVDELCNKGKRGRMIRDGCGNGAWQWCETGGGYEWWHSDIRYRDFLHELNRIGHDIRPEMARFSRHCNYWRIMPLSTSCMDTNEIEQCMFCTYKYFYKDIFRGTYWYEIMANMCWIYFSLLNLPAYTGKPNAFIVRMYDTYVPISYVSIWKVKNWTSERKLMRFCYYYT